ncbi:MAG: uroporphyrinogen-III synthase [Sphingomonas sp.]|uniref:uroporphyrinogen-III synthase n=1 Tax=Sphingomonas sp. TaxID=28214 RepID=UPI00262AB5B6|nr:uroporphyrinogen-III synthase [Sphingomonas sp.]MDK2768339.1 uroporphyrinogen-III synthase [Sphingomonas sp.]
MTRTEPDNRSTATRLKALGHDVVSVPVLGVRPFSTEQPELLPDAIVFTSMNGVRHHPIRAEYKTLPVFAVGNATAGAARDAGYSDVRSASGDVRDLQRLILNDLAPPARIVHFGARETAGDLKGFLRRFGYLVERRIVYTAQAVAIRWLLQVRTELPSIDGILVHSPRAAERVARVLAGTSWRGNVWCLSEACALRLTDVPGIQLHFTSRPDEAALIEMVRQDRVIRMPCRASLRAVSAATRQAFAAGPWQPANDNPDFPDDDDGPETDPPPAA